MQHHAADELHVEVALTERALRGLANGRESRHENGIERGAVRDLFLEFLGASAQFVVAELLDFGLERVDLLDPRIIAAHTPIVGRAEDFTGEGADH